MIDADRMKRLRTERGLSRATLARELAERGDRISERHLRRIEAGQAGDVGHRKVRAIASVLGVDPSEILR